MTALLVAIEGIDGSGKGTQVERVATALRQNGREVEVLTFPQYEKTRFGAQIGRFLNGHFGSLDRVAPELSALLFAGDRFECKPLLQQAVSENDVVLLDRYVASNIAHQAGRLSGEQRSELAEFLLWLEHDLYQLPKPEMTVWLDLPVDLAQQRIREKAKRSYTDQPADIQEEDVGHLTAASEVYASLASQPNWVRLACRELAIDEITSKIVDAIQCLAWT